MSERPPETGHASTGPKPGATCPVCRVQVDPDGTAVPFCSNRCRMVDLGAWFGEHYRVMRPIEQRDLEQE